MWGNMKKLCFYGHAGSKNHGCEALVRSTYVLLNDKDIIFDLYTFNEKEDDFYGITKYFQNVIEYRKFNKNCFGFNLHRIVNKIFKIKAISIIFDNRPLLKERNANSIYISIGGDNYCYDNYFKDLSYVNKHLNRNGSKTVLWGCSIEPDLLRNSKIVKDLKRYALITVRESITFEALTSKGIIRNTKLCPDPAFTLKTVCLNLPNGFDEDNTIGINLSPLIIDCENIIGLTLKNYILLLEHIIETTNFQIALIPHVTWESNDDRKPMRYLYDKFKETGRIISINDYNCMELKGFISRCRMFIGARTHAVIAAYSSCVPTLAVSYSVKAKGIARDIFGTYENYVISVQTLEKEDDLIMAFEWINEHQDSIRTHLHNFMPTYIEKAFQGGKEVRKLLTKQEEKAL